MFCDNMSVVYNTTAPESMLKKKSNAIAYHAVREAVSMGELLITYIRSEQNIADVNGVFLFCDIAQQERSYTE